MSNSILAPLFEQGSGDRSVVAGISEEFDFLAELEKAKSIRIATAFGHLSGWLEVEKSITQSCAATVRVLLGQAFFQTEPQLVLRLKNLKESNSASPRFDVKLAPASSTFHPKVWIVDKTDGPFAMVGSGNLSRGGLLKNVECGLLTKDQVHVESLRQWFDSHWNSSESISRTSDKYIARHQALQQQKAALQAKIDAAATEIASSEARWRRQKAIGLAAKYWRTDEGAREVTAREDAINLMRALLDYPSFEFGLVGEICGWRRALASRCAEEPAELPARGVE
jgi:HKD family nuclease